MFAIAVRIFCPSSRFIMSLRVSSDSVSMPSAHISIPPDEAAAQLRVDEVVGPGVAEPFDRQLPRDQLFAERGERLHVERDRVAPEIEEGETELPIPRSISSTSALALLSRNLWPWWIGATQSRMNTDSPSTFRPGRTIC